jgi:hypothetical protein
MLPEFLNMPGQSFTHLPPAALIGRLATFLFYGTLELLLALRRAPKTEPAIVPTSAGGYEGQGRTS